MNHTLIKAVALAACLACPQLFASATLAAEATITIAHPWLRATPRTAPVAGGYATLTNTGIEPDTLVSASLPMASEGQIHTMTMKDGVMEMRRLDDGTGVFALNKAPAELTFSNHQAEDSLEA